MSLEHGPQRQGAGNSSDWKLPSLLTDRQLAAMLATSRATVWRRVADGTLPKPIKLRHATRWLRSEIDAAIAAAVAKRDEEEE